MSNPRLLTVIAITLTVVFVLPTVCLGFPSAPSAALSHCHDDGGSTPAPTHTCCYAGHHSPASVQIVPSQVVLMVAVDSVDLSDTVVARCGHALPVWADASPPPPAVLRI